jgi:thioester reductase-like protein
MEKILRTNPDIGKIYVVVKAKDTEAALKRLQHEVYIICGVTVSCFYTHEHFLATYMM